MIFGTGEPALQRESVLGRPAPAPGPDTVRNLFSRSTQSAIESVWRPLER
jgi:hypothetical protein